MKKYLLVLVSLCCALLPALAEHPEYPEVHDRRRPDETEGMGTEPSVHRICPADLLRGVCVTLR